MPGSVTEVTERWIRARTEKIPLGVRPLVMGVLNVTPDSFSDGGRFIDPEYAIDWAYKIIAAGANIIDIGAESTKPGSSCLDVEEELRRLKPVMQVLGKQCPVPISVDTRKAEVAKQVLDWGAHIINDVSALRFNPEMGQVVAKAQAGVVLMHMQGAPETMQNNCKYGNVVEDVRKFLENRIEVAESYGIQRDQILIDPGIGFGKTTNHNLSLLKGLASFEGLGLPVLVGVSKKAFIGSVLNRPVAERMMGTAAAVTTAVLHGAHIVRVHDVEEICDVVTMATAIKQAHWN